MLKSHSIALALLSAALFPATISVGHTQSVAGVGVGAGPALAGDKLRSKKDPTFTTSTVLNDHIEAALSLSRQQGAEAGFGFYTSAEQELEYVPGEVRTTVNDLYETTIEFQRADQALLAAKLGGEDWEWVGDVHVHEGKNAQRTAGSPSDCDLYGELGPNRADTHIMMTVASAKTVAKGFDASIVFLNGDFAEQDNNFIEIFRDLGTLSDNSTDCNPSSSNERSSHSRAMDIIKDAYSGDNIRYFSGSFKGKRTNLTSGSFKNRGAP